VAAVSIAVDPGTQAAARVLRRGLAVTIRVTIVGFAFAMVLGLAAGLGRTAQGRAIREAASLYVELVRGVPLLVLILWVGFGLTPWALGQVRETVTAAREAGLALGGTVAALDTALAPCRRPQSCISLEARGILGLGVGYGAYIAEVVRAGIESVALGQREAALSLGMTRWQTMRLVVLPQALRLTLPPLGNDFIAMLKDSSLVSVLAVPDLVQQARFHISRTFQPFEVWNLVALTYLVMTASLSLGVRALERRARVEE